MCPAVAYAHEEKAASGITLLGPGEGVELVLVCDVVAAIDIYDQEASLQIGLYLGAGVGDRAGLPCRASTGSRNERAEATRRINWRVFYVQKPILHIKSARRAILCASPLRVFYLPLRSPVSPGGPVGRPGLPEALTRPPCATGEDLTAGAVPGVLLLHDQGLDHPVLRDASILREPS